MASSKKIGLVQEIEQPVKAVEDIPVKQGLRPKDFCAAAPMSRSTFQKLVADGKIRVIRFGGKIIVPHAECVRVLNHGTEG